MTAAIREQLDSLLKAALDSSRPDELMRVQNEYIAAIPLDRRLQFAARQLDQWFQGMGFALITFPLTPANVETVASTHVTNVREEALAFVLHNMLICWHRAQAEELLRATDDGG